MNKIGQIFRLHPNAETVNPELFERYISGLGRLIILFDRVDLKEHDFEVFLSNNIESADTTEEDKAYYGMIPVNFLEELVDGEVLVLEYDTNTASADELNELYLQLDTSDAALVQKIIQYNN